MYHLTASGKASWYGFAQAIFELEDKKSDRKLQRLMAITSQEYPTAASRPAYSLLDSQKFSHTYGLVLPDWKKSLELVLANNN